MYSSGPTDSPARALLCVNDKSVREMEGRFDHCRLEHVEEREKQKTFGSRSSGDGEGARRRDCGEGEAGKVGDSVPAVKCHKDPRPRATGHKEGQLESLAAARLRGRLLALRPDSAKTYKGTGVDGVPHDAVTHRKKRVRATGEQRLRTGRSECVATGATGERWNRGTGVATGA